MSYYKLANKTLGCFIKFHFVKRPNFLLKGAVILQVSDFICARVAVGTRLASVMVKCLGSLLGSLN